jgi:uroporphyrinogen-III synthase
MPTCWSSDNMRIYAVGEATACAVRNLIRLCHVRSYDHANTASALAQQIVLETKALFPGNAVHQCAPLLVLAGNKRRNELFNVLADNGIPFIEMEVYITQPRPAKELGRDWLACCKRIGGQQSDDNKKNDIVLPDASCAVDDIVFFSPSGVTAVCTHLAHRIPWRNTRVACIGPTTAERFRKWQKRSGTTVASVVVAFRPTPSSLCDAMLQVGT